MWYWSTDVVLEHGNRFAVEILGQAGDDHIRPDAGSAFGPGEELNENRGPVCIRLAAGVFAGIELLRPCERESVEFLMKAVQASVLLPVGVAQGCLDLARPAPGSGIHVSIQSGGVIPAGFLDLAKHVIELAGRIGHCFRQCLLRDGHGLVVFLVPVQDAAQQG
jgi:hypothetical protein